MSKKSGITSRWRLLNKISFLNTSNTQNHALLVVVVLTTHQDFLQSVMLQLSTHGLSSMRETCFG